MTPILLASNTGEAVAVFRVGPIVYKILQPPTFFNRHRVARLRMSPAATIERYRRTAELSWSLPPLNPCLYVAETHMIVSRFVEGRRPTTEEFKAVCAAIRGHRIWDVHPWHVIVGENGPVVIDWCVNR